MTSSLLSALENIYISPLELCNLSCKYCYTKKPKTILSNNEILDFINRYKKELPSLSREGLGVGLSLKSILFCGGEVFTLKDFPNLINTLTSQGIFVSVITNGTVDRLNEIKNPNSVQLIVSLDGLKDVHDQNRGQGNFDKSIAFLQKAQSLGFHLGIFFLITKDSYFHKDALPKYLESKLKNLKSIPITYLTDRLMSLTREQLLDIKKNYPTYPRKEFGCFQLALQSDGKIYGCCESPTPLAKITDTINIIIKNFISSLDQCHSCPISTLNDEDNNFSERKRKGMQPEHGKISLSSRSCFGCCNPNYLCGYKKELQLLNCTDVVKEFN